MKGIFKFLLLVFFPFSLYSLNYEAYFNKSPSNDALDVKLINKLNSLPVNSRLEMCLYSISRDNIVSTLTNIASVNNVTINIVVEKNNINSDYALLDEHSNITVKTDDNSKLMHNKFIIFDYKGVSSVANMVWTGSLNLTDNGVDKNAQNVIILKNQSLASEYSNEFYQMFSYDNYGTSKTPHSTHSFFIEDSTVEAYFSPEDDPASRLIELINSAQYSIYYCIFTFTDPDIIDALISKYNQGIDVIGVCDGWQSENYKSYGIYTRANEAGMPIYKDKVENQPDSGFYLLHHKFMVIDYGYVNSDPLVVTGSYNWTGAGNDDNDENMLVLHNNDAARDYFYEFCARLEEAGGIPPTDPALSDPPGEVVNFEAFPVYPDYIRLKWINPIDEDLQRVLIKVSQETFINDPSVGESVGTIIGQIGQPVHLDYNTDLKDHQRYYFTAFIYDTTGNYSISYASCVFFSPSSQGCLADNFIKPYDYNNVEIYFAGSSPETIEIYNLFGSIIKKINNIYSKKIIWDLKNEHEQKVGSGIYFFVYNVNGKTVRKKVLIAR